ncbi:right-handed parallel beta-helix repeat-containing protein [Myxococcus sp. K15C18031901]|uniref:right-handed parallel beta-helix repeat-containing protein n=1 Tax=Myxococcus dinghuensis TaxID=2906761 RepID=UPI0020A6FCE6|nr:right-handed parallel beta-helix repeat-containing protein [Myxococcus dinghuensis]MCP3102239.1 right-handed parallel beta-helix repeat-containing protein [Myxococcus dinghuensis]
MGRGERLGRLGIVLLWTLCAQAPAWSAAPRKTGASFMAVDLTRPAPGRPKRFTREWFVSPSGSDQAAGTKQAPLRTIGRAVRSVGPGEVIRVAPGEYAEGVVIDGAVKAGREDAPITLLGEGQPRIVPAKGGGTLVQVRKPHWIVEGFDLDVRGQPRFAVLFAGDTRGSVLASCHIHHGSLGAGVATFGGARDVLITNNHIHHFQRRPGGDSHGVVVQATSRDITVRGNDIHDNSGDSVQCLLPDKPDEVPARGLVIEDNLLHANGENAVDIKTCQGVTIRRNTMHGFRKSPTSAGEAVVIHFSARDVRVEHNLIYDSGRGVAVGGSREGDQPSPVHVVVRGNVIRDITRAGGSDGAGIRVENSRDVRVEDNAIDRTEGYGMMLGLGSNGAPSEDLTVRGNVIQGRHLVRLGQHRPGLKMGRNQYGPGGLFKVDPEEISSITRWKKASGVDDESTELR